MRKWTEWEIMRHQVAVAGRVLDPNNQPVAGRDVTLARLPEKTKERRSRSKSHQKQLDAPKPRMATYADGIFFFLDAPAGNYSVECIDERSGLQAEKTVSISWKADGTVEKAVADLKLSKA